jgi:hypothetical protein
VWSGVIQCCLAGAAMRERRLLVHVRTWQARGGRAGRVRLACVDAARVRAPARHRLRFGNERSYIDFTLTLIASRPQKRAESGRNKQKCAWPKYLSTSIGSLISQNALRSGFIHSMYVVGQLSKAINTRVRTLLLASIKFPA